MSIRKRPYEDLIIWQEAHRLCQQAFAIVDTFPQEQNHELCSQIRRAAYSVPMNIVEANMKRTKKNRLNFLNHAESSLEELDYQFLLSRDLKYITAEQFEKLRLQIGKVGYLLERFRNGIVLKK